MTTQQSFGIDLFENMANNTLSCLLYCLVKSWNGRTISETDMRCATDLQILI